MNKHISNGVIYFITLFFGINSPISIAENYSFRNPVIPGFYPDPSIVRVEADYYMVNSSFEFFPGIPVWHSRDLINWTKIGHCANTPEKSQLATALHSHGFFAATIEYHKGTFYIAVQHRTLGKNFIFKTNNPAGEWLGPVIGEQKGGDPSLFFDDDGKAYFVTSSDSIYVSEIDVNTGKRLSTTKGVWAGTGGRFPEGPHIFKNGEYYYLTIAEGGTEYGHMQTIARSKNLRGIYESCPRNPILTHRDKGTHRIQGIGHTDFFTDTDGKWWLVCLAYRQVAPYQQFHHLGRETFLAPVEWDSLGWPIVNKNQGLELTMVTDRPIALKHAETEWIDHFGTEQLNLEWNTLRQPIPDYWSLKERNGWLCLRGQATNLDHVGSPTFIGRRLQHFNSTTTVKLDFNPTKDGEEAGLAVYKKDQHHYEIGITRIGGKRMLIVRRTIGTLSSIVAKEEIKKGCVELKITTKPFEITFSYSINSSPFKQMASGETRYLSTEVAKSYTGLYLGMYATGNGKPSQKLAFFDWFAYQPE